MSTTSKKGTRASEIALLESISSSLDTYIGDNPQLTQTPKRKKSSASASDVSKNAAKNFLAAKTLVKSIAKVCAQENVVIAVDNGGTSDALIDVLVDEYKEKYPSLTKKMLVDWIVRYNTQNETALGGSANAVAEDDTKDDNTQLKFGRIISIVDGEMNKYYAKIEALKKSREMAASVPEPQEAAAKSNRKRKSIDSENEASPKAAKQKRGPRKEKDTPENFLIKEIVKNYAVARESHERLPNGLFETIVEDTKRQCQMEYVDLDLNKLDKKIRAKYNKMIADDDPRAPSKHKVIVDEVYARYTRTKEANGGKLQAGTMHSIIEGVKLEYGMPDLKVNSLKVRVQAKFTKEHPEFQGNNPGQLKIGELLDEEKKRRQLLLNEITARYIREKEGTKKLADGSLDRIIESTKNELNIHEFEVPKASIRGRIHRKSPHVQTLGNESPYDVIDEPLVATINGWLSQGISVTRDQGLELANRLLKGRNLEKDTFGNTLVLDAKWWRNFLERNKRKLVCSSD
eukprot:CAMPEP_0172319152 /NCGR_PEP_ID=MMETSP1058-20130122/36955_1 /TAXON_ID=83371 /ORGANISM="Detonula confervacea, Strain CCMP 353" /LENGTH=515 /DNA_ID=CAMNT_0013034145 /DNA_START=44 /DNA_END=1591 /DNA_ORIENTATION=-